MYSPLSQYRYITPLSISFSIVLTVALILLEAGNAVMLCINWVTAGIVAFIIGECIVRFKLHEGFENKTLSISWPLLTAGLHFACCHFPKFDSFYKAPPQILGLMLVISISMSLWQRRQATIKCLLLGLFIGFVSAAVPHAILWLLLFPVTGYTMRCWSARNAFSVLTGTAFAIWIVYCILFFVQGADAANAMLASYGSILRSEDYPLFQGLGLWQYLFMGISLMLLIFYSVTGFLINAGQNIRTDLSLKLTSFISVIFIMFMVFDVRHFYSNLCFFLLFIALQLTIHQASIRSQVHEWWIVLINLVYIALCILPCVCPI